MARILFKRHLNYKAWQISIFNSAFFSAICHIVLPLYTKSGATLGRPGTVAGILDDALSNHLTLFDLAVDPPELWEKQRERIGGLSAS